MCTLREGRNRSSGILSRKGWMIPLQKYRYDTYESHGDQCDEDSEHVHACDECCDLLKQGMTAQCE